MPNRFEVVWQAAPADWSVVLRSTANANAAMAFHEAMRHLRRQAASGEVFVRNGTDAQPPLLRQPLNHHKHHA
jgi:capsid protein